VQIPKYKRHSTLLSLRSVTHTTSKNSLTNDRKQARQRWTQAGVEWCVMNTFYVRTFAGLSAWIEIQVFSHRKHVHRIFMFMVPCIKIYSM